MNPATKTTASKAIRYYQREFGRDRLTGGLLPTQNGLMVAVKQEPSEPSSSQQQAAAANGNGSTASQHSSRALQALLIVPDKDAVRASLGEAIPSGHPIGPGGDLVTEQTRSDILTWREDELEPDGSLSESYVVSVAASLIHEPPASDTAFEEALAEAQQAEARAAEEAHNDDYVAIAHDTTDSEADTTEMADAAPQARDGNEQQPAREDHPGSQPGSQDQYDVPEPNTQHNPPAEHQPEIHEAPEAPEQQDAKISVPELADTESPEQSPEQTSESSVDREGAAQPADGDYRSTATVADHETEANEAGQAQSADEVDDSIGATECASHADVPRTEDAAGAAPSVAPATSSGSTHTPSSAEQQESTEEQGRDHEPDDDPGASRASLQYPAGEGPRETVQPDSAEEDATEEDFPGASEPGAQPQSPETGAGIGASDGHASSSTAWLEEMTAGASPTPEQRAYYIGKQKAQTLLSKLTFKRPPQEPPRLASISSPIQESAIARISNSRKGPGIVVPMISKGGTGKTTVAIELAFMLGLIAGAYGDYTAARTGKVLVVDMNITNPDLHRRLKVDGDGRMGLKDLISGERLSRVVNRTPLPNVDAMFLLGQGDNDKGELPRALKDPHTMEAIINTIAGKGGYDMIVVDTANTMPAEEDNEASYSLTMWALAADARYLILQPEKASLENGAWFTESLGRALGDDARTVPILNSLPMDKVYSEAPVTTKMRANRRDAMQAITRMQAAETNHIVPAIGPMGDELKMPLFIPDYPEEVRSFAAEGRPLCMYSQTFSNAYERIALDAVRRMLDNRKPN